MDSYFEDESVTIYHGDSTEILPTLPEESVDMVMIDPPYGTGYRGRFDRKHAPMEGDKKQSKYDWIAPLYDKIFRILRNDSFMLSFYGWPHVEVFMGAWKAAGFSPVSLLEFHKNMLGYGYFTRNQHESAYLLAKGSPPKPVQALSDVTPWKRPKHRVTAGEKPVESLLPWARHYCPPNGVILDACMGESGSSIRAAVTAGHHAIGIDVSEAACKSVRGFLDTETYEDTQGEDPCLPFGRKR